jgi:signal transduction histidine kinase
MTSTDKPGFLPRVFHDTSFRLSLLFVSLFCAAVAATFMTVYTNLQTILDNGVETGIQSDLQSLQDRFATGRVPGLVNAIEERVNMQGDVLLQLADPDGKTVAGNLERLSGPLLEAKGSARFAYTRVEQGHTVQRQAFGYFTQLPTGQRLVVARDVENLERAKQVMRQAFFAGYGLIAAIGLLGGFLVSSRILKRMDAASNTAHAIMNGNLDRRIPISARGDEFDRLSQNLNAMLDRIGDLMNGLKTVSDNIAHDLKTPLHRLRTRAERALATGGGEAALREALTSVIEEADELIRTFDALLSIARLEAGSRDRTFGPVDICALTRDVAELYEPAAEEHGLRIEFQCGAEDLVVSGEKHLIGQAVANLLDNAIKYAGRGPNPGGPAMPHIATITVATRLLEGSAEIVVGDRGPGIAPHDRERALQRFVRLEASRSQAGSGLGLSLVAAVARLHGGSVILEDNDPGLRVRLRLPGATQPAHTAPTVFDRAA